MITIHIIRDTKQGDWTKSETVQEIKCEDGDRIMITCDKGEIMMDYVGEQEEEDKQAIWVEEDKSMFCRSLNMKFKASGEIPNEIFRNEQGNLIMHHRIGQGLTLLGLGDEE